MKKLFGSIKEVEVTLSLEELALEIGDVTNITLLSAELERSIEGDFEKLDTILFKIDETLSAVERLENIASVISTHGICRATMEAIDPYNELVSSGLCVSYELLSDVPVKDEYADQAVEGITDVLKTFFNKIFAFFRSIADGIKDIGVAWKRAVFGWNSDLSIVRKSLKTKKTFNEEKFGKKRIRAYSKADFTKVVGALDSLISATKSTIVDKTTNQINSVISGKKYDKATIDAFNNKIASNFKVLNAPIFKDAFGMYVDMKEDGDFNFVTSVDRKIKMERTELSTLGWKASDGMAIVDKVYNQIASLVAVGHMLAEVDKSIRVVSKFLEQIRGVYDELSAEEKAGFKYFIASSRRHYNTIFKLFRTTYSAQRDIFYSGYIVGKMADKYGK